MKLIDRERLCPCRGPLAAGFPTSFSSTESQVLLQRRQTNRSRDHSMCRRCRPRSATMTRPPRRSNSSRTTVANVFVGRSWPHHRTRTPRRQVGLPKSSSGGLPASISSMTSGTSSADSRGCRLAAPRVSWFAGSNDGQHREEIRLMAEAIRRRAEFVAAAWWRKPTSELTIPPSPRALHRHREPRPLERRIPSIHPCESRGRQPEDRTSGDIGRILACQDRSRTACSSSAPAFVDRATVTCLIVPPRQLRAPATSLGADVSGKCSTAQPNVRVPRCVPELPSTWVT